MKNTGRYRRVFILFICHMLFAVTAASAQLRYNHHSKKVSAANKNLRVLNKRINHYERLINKNPTNANAHRFYAWYAGLNNPRLKKQYATLTQVYPNSTKLFLIIGNLYFKEELPEARKYLLKAVELNPNMPQAWYMLAVDAQRRGIDSLFTAYVAKAASLDSANANYAFNYAMGVLKTDTLRAEGLVQTMSKRFPIHPLTFQALTIIGSTLKDTADRIHVLEGIRDTCLKYYKSTYNWPVYAMRYLFDLYLSTSPKKAAELADLMHFKYRGIVARQIHKVDSLASIGDYNTALDLLSPLKVGNSPDDDDEIYKNFLIEKVARTQMKNNDYRSAYDFLIGRAVSSPNNRIFNLLNEMGTKINKTEDAIYADIWLALQKGIRRAPNFSSRVYTSDNRVYLRDFRGKVVLLTFWFPGCGPCRAEFPYFENVLRKFDRDKVEYLGINVSPQQDSLVLPLINGRKLTFTPLHGSEEIARKVFHTNGYPANLLIDQDGQIVYSNFMIGQGNEDRLEMMLKIILNKRSISPEATAVEKAGK